MKLGVICDGISRDLAHSINVMDEFGLEYAELQFVGDKEVGDHSKTEIKEIDNQEQIDLPMENMVFLENSLLAKYFTGAKLREKNIFLANN